MATAMVQGALAANLSLTNVPFSLSSDTMAAPGGMAVVMTGIGSDGDTATGAAAEVGVPKAGLDGICVHATQSVKIGGLDLGTYSLNISSPATGATASQLASGAAGLQANNLILNAQSVTAAKATLDNAGGTAPPTTIGASADSINSGTSGIKDGAAGAFGLSATGGQATVENLLASANGATLGGSITLPDLRIALAVGDTQGTGAGQTASGC
ncbi:hypothetical protein LO762_21695 [Actinocorallia sp. API 0066]|uniref:hypothetical protein n=1 Tax=Actinocorallia sp. API 0066 TaxID=2896846 RepID=UPI001E2FD873|nr:hypothetical protein [Actinocorallia sp. API 0066]MCD0451788.1 hypothetical protein [Actinocorallia sp. API 0066]